MNQPHSIATQHETLFEHGYPIDAPDLRRLYENAKRDQWNAAKDIDWNQPFDPADGVLADDLIDIYNTPHWDRLTREERAEFNRRFANWRLGVLLYGEHGAMLVCSQLVESVSGSDAKLFQATQVMDEARHTEVLARYVEQRLGGLRYPLPGFEKELFDTMLGERRWTIKTIGLQLVAETFAVALFRMLAESSKDPLLRQICQYILQDESRHMGFGMLSLPDVMGEMTDAERKELEEFTQWALVQHPHRPVPRAGLPRAGLRRQARSRPSTRIGASARPAPRARTSASCSARTCTARCWEPPEGRPADRAHAPRPGVGRHQNAGLNGWGPAGPPDPQRSERPGEAGPLLCRRRLGASHSLGDLLPSRRAVACARNLSPAAVVSASKGGSAWIGEFASSPNRSTPTTSPVVSSFGGRR